MFDYNYMLMVCMYDFSVDLGGKHGKEKYHIIRCE